MRFNYTLCVFIFRHNPFLCLQIKIINKILVISRNYIEKEKRMNSQRSTVPDVTDNAKTVLTSFDFPLQCREMTRILNHLLVRPERE